MLGAGDSSYPLPSPFSHNLVWERHRQAILDLKWEWWSSQVVFLVKNLPTNAEDIRDLGSIPGSGRTPGEGNGNPLQYSCLENPMDRGAWWAKPIGAQRIRHD